MQSRIAETNGPYPADAEFPQSVVKPGHANDIIGLLHFEATGSSVRNCLAD